MYVTMFAMCKTHGSRDKRGRRCAISVCRIVWLMFGKVKCGGIGTPVSSITCGLDSGRMRVHSTLTSFVRSYRLVPHGDIGALMSTFVDSSRLPPPGYVSVRTLRSTPLFRPSVSRGQHHLVVVSGFHSLLLGARRTVMSYRTAFSFFSLMTTTFKSVPPAFPAHVPRNPLAYVLLPLQTYLSPSSQKDANRILRERTIAPLPVTPFSCVPADFSGKATSRRASPIAGTTSDTLPVEEDHAAGCFDHPRSNEVR